MAEITRQAYIEDCLGNRYTVDDILHMLAHEDTVYYGDERQGLPLDAQTSFAVILRVNDETEQILKEVQDKTNRLVYLGPSDSVPNQRDYDGWNQDPAEMTQQRQRILTTARCITTVPVTFIAHNRTAEMAHYTYSEQAIKMNLVKPFFHVMAQYSEATERILTVALIPLIAHEEAHHMLPGHGHNQTFYSASFLLACDKYLRHLFRIIDEENTVTRFIDTNRIQERSSGESQAANSPYEHGLLQRYRDGYRVAFAEWPNVASYVTLFKGRTLVFNRSSQIYQLLAGMCEQEDASGELFSIVFRSYLDLAYDEVGLEGEDAICELYRRSELNALGAIETWMREQCSQRESDTESDDEHEEGGGQMLTCPGCGHQQPFNISDLVIGGGHTVTAEDFLTGKAIKPYILCAGCKRKININISF